MGTHKIQRSGLFALFLVAALLWAGGALAKGLNCTCINCTYAQGRAQTTYIFDADFNATPAGRAAYNAAESAAMQAADAAAVAAMSAAAKNSPSCPQPCWAMPFWSLTHGKPFAGGTGGSGIARSLWKITYSCIKVPVLFAAAPPGTAPPAPPAFCVGCTTQVVQPAPPATTPPQPTPPATTPPQPTQPATTPPQTSQSPPPQGNGGPTCVGQDGITRITQIETAMSGDATELVKRLDEYRQLFGSIAVPVGQAGQPSQGQSLFGSVALDALFAKYNPNGGTYRDLDPSLTLLRTDANYLVPALQTQQQRVDDLNRWAFLPPCATSQQEPVPPPGQYNSNGMGWSLRWNFGGGDHGGSDSGGGRRP